MKVLYVSKSAVVAAHRDKLCWLKEHVDLQVVVPDRWAGPAEPADDGVAVTALPVLFPGRHHLHLYRGLGGAIERFGPDLLHVDEEPYSAVTLQSALHAGRRGLPFVFFAWQNIPKRYPPPFNAVRASVFRRAAGGIAGSEAAAAVLKHFGFGGPLAVIPQMGVDPTLFRPDPEARQEMRRALDLPPDTVLVGYLGRLVPEKGVDLFLDALSGVPGVHAVVGGQGPELERLRARAAREDLRGRVSFAGQVPSLEVPSWLAALDVLTLPSRSTPRWKEQFGRVLIEAMACGVAVVATESGEMPAVVGDAGILVPEDDTEALGRALHSLATDADRRGNLACLGRSRVTGHFTQERVIENTLDFYDEVLAAEAM